MVCATMRTFTANCLLTARQFWELHEDSGQESEIDNVAKEVQLIVAVRDNYLHNRHGDDVDRYHLQIGIVEAACDDTATYDDRPEEIPEGEIAEGPQAHPDPVDRVVRDKIVDWIKDLDIG